MIPSSMDVLDQYLGSDALVSGVSVEFHQCSVVKHVDGNESVHFLGLYSSLHVCR